MSIQRTLVAVHDDEFGVGAQLAFPTMSSCASIVCVLNNTLVGIHKTGGWDNKRQHLFQLAVQAINGATVNRLYIAGWKIDDANWHDVQQIQTVLGCQNVPTYVFNFAHTVMTIVGNLEILKKHELKTGLFKNPMNDLCTFAFHTNANKARIAVKRTSKVSVNNSNRNTQKTNLYNQHGGDFIYYAVTETLTTPSNNLHDLNFTRL